MIVNCYECGKELRYEEKQKAEYCPICGTINFKNNNKLTFNKEMGNTIKAMFIAIERSSKDLARAQINKILKIEYDNPFAYLGKLLLNVKYPLVDNVSLDDDLCEDVFNYLLNKNDAFLDDIMQTFNLGFNRATAILKSLEKSGAVSQFDGEKRTILVTNLSELKDDSRGIRRLLKQINSLKENDDYKRLMFFQKKKTIKLL